MQQIDLLLGGDLGCWLLNSMQSAPIKNIFSFDKVVINEAESLGLPFITDDINTAHYEHATTALSVHYPRIVCNRVLQHYTNAYNVHPGYLPWGRGYYPVFWALWEETPAGATLHSMVAEVDKGNIIDQIQVAYSSEDTGGSLFDRVREAERELLRRHWHQIVNGITLVGKPQPDGVGTFHTKKEFFELKQLHTWNHLSSHDLVRLVRCLSFPGYTGLEIMSGSRRFELSLKPVE